LSQLTNIYVDSEELDYEKLILQRNNQILIPKNSINIGDKLNFIYSERNNEVKEVTFLSIGHERSYKNLALEVELEFIKKKDVYEQSFELIVRAVNKWDKTYTADEYYAFGIKGESFYFAKISYRNEGKNSFPYKILYDLNKEEDGISKFFVSINDDARNKLFLSDFGLNYDNKYKFRCEIINDIISFKIKDVSKIESFETNFPWISVYEGVNINQTEETISKRTPDLRNIVAVSEPNTLIDGEGLFGFAVPNSHVKVYRFEVTPLDENFDINLYDDEQYSKTICSDFSYFYGTNNELRLNSSNSIKEVSNDFREFYGVEGTSIDITDKITMEDVKTIQINGVEVERNLHYEDKFFDIISPMSSEHNGSTLKAFVDSADVNVFGETERYFSLEEYTDGVSFQYDIDEEVINKIKYYPKGKLGQVLLEVDSDIVFDDFNLVGLKKNPEKFITSNVLEELYNGRKFFMETSFRGKKRFFELGPLGNGRFVFEIDRYFASANDSYEAIWKYNLANFIDSFFGQYSIVSYIQGVSGLIPSEFSFTETTPIIDFDYTQYDDSFGYVIATMNVEDIIILSNKTKSQVTPQFSVKDNQLDSDVKRMIKKGVNPEHIRLVLGVYQNIMIDLFKKLLDRVVIKDKSFEFTIDEIIANYGGSLFQDYREFRAQWMEDLDHNSHITTGGLESRTFYVSEDERKVSIDIEEKQIVFVDTPPVNRKIVIRVFYENQITLTNSYHTLDSFYRVDEGIKQLYEKTMSNRGVVKVLEYYDAAKYGIIEKNGVPFVIVPKNINENDSKLFADVELCTPFIENTEGVRRKVKVPLVKISDFLKNDFESSVYGEKYIYTSKETEGWNRESDFVDLRLEIMSGDSFEYEFPKMFPLPEGIQVENYFDSSNQPNETNEFFIKLLSGNVVANKIVDEYLNVSSWYNVNDSKLGDFYKKVLETIIEVKSLNRYYTDQRMINEDIQNPLSLGNWFDGFYSGERTSWALSENGRYFGKYEGNPWGTQNSRKQMIEQIKNTLQNKFSQYEIYFVDYTYLKHYQSYNTMGFDSKQWDTNVYPISGNERLIHNPYIDDKVSKYVMGVDIIDEVTGEVIFYSDDFSFFTNNQLEYPNETIESYGNELKTKFSVNGIVREIQNGVDMYWGFNTAILFDRERGMFLPEGVMVSAEYQYAMNPYYESANNPRSFVQKTHLGRSNGVSLQKFPNPDVFSYSNITYSLVHRIWLDNYIVNDYTVFDLGQSGGRIHFNSLPNGFEKQKDICIRYNVNNYYDLKVKNIFVDNFNNKRDLKWLGLTKDKKGYLKKTNPYIGYVIDNTKFKSEHVYHLSQFSSTEGDFEIKTASTANVTDLIRPIQYGQDREDIISLLSIRRNNNFEISVDVIFDENTERDLMQTDIIFRGKFNNSDGRQYFNENYSITIGLENSSIALIARSINELGVHESQLLVNVRSISSIIQRNKFYTIKFSVISDVLRLYFNERNQKEMFYFSYDLRTGHKKDGIEAVAESLLNGLGIKYEDPKFYVNGDRIGIRSLSPKTNFSNFKFTAFEENNFKLGNTFDVVNFDNIISTLQLQYKLTGQFKKLKRTTNGYEYLLIGNNLFAKQNGGTYVKHSFVVEDFEVIGEYVYVRERLLETSNFEVINVYKDTLKMVNNIVVDGKQFIDEPILSYQIDSSRVISNIENINGKLFITTNKSCIFAKVWENLQTCTWDNVTEPWDIYG